MEQEVVPIFPFLDLHGRRMSNHALCHCWIRPISLPLPILALKFANLYPCIIWASSRLGNASLLFHKILVRMGSTRFQSYPIHYSQ